MSGSTQQSCRRVRKPIIAPQTAQTSWAKCRQRVNAQLSKIKYNAQLLRAYDNDDPEKCKLVKPTQELEKAQNNLLQAKKRIIETLAEAESSCNHHTTYPQLSGDSGDFDVMNIFCSKCGGTEEEDNDILYCDRRHCNKAYHQKCLSVPLATKDIPEDFFCDCCDCVLDCLDHINEVCETSYERVSDLFPEVQKQQKENDDDGCSSDGTVQHSDDDDKQEDELTYELWPSDCSSDEDFAPRQKDKRGDTHSGTDSHSEVDSEDDSDNSSASEDEDDDEISRSPRVTRSRSNSVTNRSSCRTRYRSDRVPDADERGDDADDEHEDDVEEEEQKDGSSLLTNTRLRKRARVDYVQLASQLGYDAATEALDNDDEDYS